MLGNIWVTAAGYVATAVVGWLWLEARDDIIEAVEGCNTRITAAALESERLVRETLTRAAQEREAQLQADIDAAERAAAIARQAASEAASRPVEVREVIREVASANACIDTAVPALLVDSVFSD